MKTTTTIDLTRFCWPDANRENLQTPFSQGEFTYSSDGRIAVRVSRIDGYEERNDFPMDGIFDPPFSAVERWEPWPTPDIAEKQNCFRCEGSGKKLTECRTCFGVGTFECEACAHPSDCPVCYGVGGFYRDGICPICEGEKQFAYSDELCRVAGQRIGNPYWVLISRLPNIEAGIKSEEHRKSEPRNWSAIPFRFDGGEGVIMPVKEPPNDR